MLRQGLTILSADLYSCGTLHRGQLSDGTAWRAHLTGLRVCVRPGSHWMCPSASQVVQSVLQGAGFSRTDDPADASVVLLNTCAIREGAEQRIWGRLGRFKALKAERRAAARRESGCAMLFSSRHGLELVSRSEDRLNHAVERMVHDSGPHSAYQIGPDGV